MPHQERTKAFRSCVDSIRTRTSQPTRAVEKQRLLAQRGENKSEFTQMATSIAKDINSTSLKLNKLGQCMPLFLPYQYGGAEAFLVAVARRKTLFDDRPVEISVRLTLL